MQSGGVKTARPMATKGVSGGEARAEETDAVKRGVGKFQSNGSLLAGRWNLQGRNPLKHALFPSFSELAF